MIYYLLKKVKIKNTHDKFGFVSAKKANMNFIDFYGLPCESDNDYVVKELAIVGIKDGKCSISHYIYAPPYAWEYVPRGMKGRYQRLARNPQALKWTDGSRAYLKLASDLQMLDGAVWTLGDQRAHFLADIIGRQVHNRSLALLGC